MATQRACRKLQALLAPWMTAQALATDHVTQRIQQGGGLSLPRALDRRCVRNHEYLPLPR